MSAAILHRNKRGKAVFTPNGTASNYRWTSSDETIATITNNGSNTQEIVALANGNAVISCKFDGASEGIVKNKNLVVIDPGADDGEIEITENP